ncbi:hypothetical protein B0T17DRAFT_486432 [Bombardia bombarda]|uniref:Flavonol synthase n=1 Tax=Bombardia bombarda TaxID=252184 RepID=A0AA39X900_9PEZI|nr:hypothetical protein B0T17DRAFT_486432 [Bombardia bombarda]
MATVVETYQASSGILPAYQQVPETKYDLEWADLVTLDLSKFDQPGGKEALARQLFDAIRSIGFFYIVNFGLSQEEIDEQFAIGKAIFKLPVEEKLQYRADLENGGYNGYKPAGIRQLQPGLYDNTEIYNIPKFIPLFAKLPHPAVITAHKAQISHFARHIHESIIHKLLVLFAIILELREDAFTSRHRYEEPSDCHLRYMYYHRRTPEENAALNNVWVKGHTDFGSLTLLFRQPVAALQVRSVVVSGNDSEGEWKWVRPLPGSITVNIADALEFLTNGFLKSSIHRVVAPPPDQADINRLGVLYFLRPEDNVELVPVQGSAVLERLGYHDDRDEAARSSAVGITGGEWVRARVKAGVGLQQQSKKETGGGTEEDRTKGGNDRDVSEQEILKGKTVKYYD